MQIHFFYPRWGSEDIEWPAFCKKVKNAGYHGVEAAIPFSTAESDEMLEALREYDLLLIAQYYQSFEKQFTEHADNYRRYLEHYSRFSPYLINAQTGKDYFSSEQNGTLFELARKVEADYGIRVCHETHRNKALYASHVARRLLEQFDYIHLTADFSHWCCVSESLLEDHTEAVQLACDRTGHLHARVGHRQGAQVNDPRAPEWAAELNAHLVWWDKIVHRLRQSKASAISITTEFGPPPYLPTLPYSGMPVASQWDINNYIKDLLKSRYAVK